MARLNIPTIAEAPAKAQPILEKAASPFTIAFCSVGSVGITRPGTAMAAWNKVAAVTSARVSSFAKPSPS